MVSRQRLYKDMIRDTEHWSLYIAIDDSCVEIMIYNQYEDNSLLSTTIELDTSVHSHCEAVEEAVYDNPLLLNTFNKVTILSRSKYYTYVPTQLTGDKERCEALLRETVGNPSQWRKAVMLIDEVPLLSVSLCYYVDEDLHNFLLRTFGQTTRFVHRLTSLTTYFHGTHRAAGSLTSYVNVGDKLLDIVIYNGDTLLIANSYEWEEPADALYYVVKTRQLCGSNDTHPVILSGNRDAREVLMPVMRQHLRTVMPAIFPVAMFKAGSDVAMNTSTDLIFLPLCE